MDLSLLAGNEPLKRQLSLNAARRGLSHAYILAGPAGSGRHTLARLLAAALVCGDADEGVKPCLHCSGCKKALGGIHPDIITVENGEKDVTVAQIRDMRSDAYIRPNESPRKVYLLEGAQNMNANAQNAMLKLLEEGPAYAAFLLLADNAAALLETVRSRCELLTLSPVSQEEAVPWLSRRFPERTEATVRAAADACGGLLGRAVSALEGSDAPLTREREAALTLLQHLTRGDELSLFQFTTTLEKWDRDALSGLFSEGVTLLRSALIIQAGANCGESDPQRQAAVSAAAQTLSAKTMLSAVETLERLRAACGYNAGAGHLAGWLCAALQSISF